MTSLVIVKATGEEKTAVYATTPTGNKRYNVDGKFYTDKQFDKCFKIAGEILTWKTDTKALFKEIIGCGGPAVKILDKPLQITYEILRQAAERAIELQDRKMIAIMARLGLYEGSADTEHPEHEKLNELIDEFY